MTSPGRGHQEGRADLLAAGAHRRRLSMEACSEHAIRGLNTPHQSGTPLPRAPTVPLITTHV